MPGPYRKHFIPLESDPEVFTRLLHKLGISPDLRFQEIYAIDEPDQLPHPALALVFIFPAPAAYEVQKAKEDSGSSEYAGGDDQDVMWFKQTIHNACGFYALLHSVCNGPAKAYIQPGTLLGRLMDTCRSLGTEDRIRVLEDSKELETIYAEAAREGGTPVPGAEEEVDSHYICFVKSTGNSHLYELDGDRKGPVDKGFVEADDVLAEESLNVVKQYMQDAGLGHGLMALVSDSAR
ncbi:cysteine proteinase [Eremomyces bilateralis CBS 781.70]|uniref:Ubiquitin carboxyl-terminal hydrolase n=1 Tax=Eremomyces bilateralis CBS 781.70 TaxID=1392243 RepID=A0A6G1FUZ0_9PEZI|nr:cysteine proteinase [Eremomyces bilateralis CBS 781.70]KAF1809471.1 cysteine proteinase [Eremomyces bilateralis CBS 781.70]